MSGQRVLLVDDDARTLAVVAAHLALRGYEVIGEGSGEAGLVAAANQPPELIILDMGMTGMDGVETCRRLRAAPATAAVPVLMITSTPRPDDVDRARAVGANHLITKPYNLAGLELVVRSLLSPGRP